MHGVLPFRSSGEECIFRRCLFITCEPHAGVSMFVDKYCETGLRFDIYKLKRIYKLELFCPLSLSLTSLHLTYIFNVALRTIVWQCDFGVASQDVSSPVTDVVTGVSCSLEEYYARGQYQEAERSWGKRLRFPRGDDKRERGTERRGDSSAPRIRNTCSPVVYGD